MEIPRPSRTCSVSHRDFCPHEPFYSILIDDEGALIRQDVAMEHWTGPPQECFGWWKSVVKHVSASPAIKDSGESLQNVFERLAAQPDENMSDTMYILTLLLLRRKMLRYEKEITDEKGNRHMEVYSFQTNTAYQVPIAMPNAERLEAIQQQIADWGG